MRWSFLRSDPGHGPTRNGISKGTIQFQHRRVDIERKYLAQAHARLLDAVGLFRESGPSRAHLIFKSTG